MGWAFIIGVIFILVCVAATRRPGRLIRICSNPVALTDKEGPVDTSEVFRVKRYRRVSRLSEEDRYGFLQVWRSVRTRFSADPRLAVAYADLLTSDLIQHCTCPALPAGDRTGAPFDDCLQCKYVAAHEIALRDRRERIVPGELARAMTLYEAIFDDLLGAPSQRHARN